MTKLTDERELLSKPGDTILETVQHLRMSQVELARRMGKTASKINDLISGKEPITPKTAFQLEKVLGIDAEFWLNREMLYRQKLLRLEQKEALKNCIDWLKIQPIKELKKYGYIASKRVGPIMVEECLKFYGVATPNEWEEVYVTQYLSSSFRKSPAYKATLGGLATFLRMGEIEMRKLNLGSFRKADFKEALKEIRVMVRSHPEDFASRLQKLCSDVGVAVIYTANIPKAPISGAARWVGGIPLIQLTDRYKSNDHFWFSFFHEAGHVMLHGKKQVFVENLKGCELDPQMEAEADDFANKWLLPEDITADLPHDITENDIRLLALRYNTHTAIVVGRLQHLELLSYRFGNNLKQKVALDKYINRH